MLSRKLVFASSIAAALLCVTSAWAATKAERTRAAASIVEAALHEEAEGALVDRPESLIPALSRCPTSSQRCGTVDSCSNAKERGLPVEEDASVRPGQPVGGLPAAEIQAPRHGREAASPARGAAGQAHQPSPSDRPESSS